MNVSHPPPLSRIPPLLSAQPSSLLLTSKTPCLVFLFFWPFFLRFCCWLLILHLLLSVETSRGQVQGFFFLPHSSVSSPSTSMASIVLCIPVVSDHECPPLWLVREAKGTQCLADGGKSLSPPVLLDPLIHVSNSQWKRTNFFSG